MLVLKQHCRTTTWWCIATEKAQLGRPPVVGESNLILAALSNRGARRHHILAHGLWNRPRVVQYLKGH